jgi:hypothetical protein
MRVLLERSLGRGRSALDDPGARGVVNRNDAEVLEEHRPARRVEHDDLVVAAHKVSNQRPLCSPDRLRPGRDSHHGPAVNADE